MYLLKRQAVVISFSGSYKAFIGYTRGYNPLSEREYLLENIEVLSVVENAVKFRKELTLDNIPGGRVFIRKDLAFVRNINFQNDLICHWEWQGVDPYILISNFYDLMINN